MGVRNTRHAKSRRMSAEMSVSVVRLWAIPCIFSLCLRSLVHLPNHQTPKTHKPKLLKTTVTTQKPNGSALREYFCCPIWSVLKPWMTHQKKNPAKPHASMVEAQGSSICITIRECFVESLYSSSFISCMITAAISSIDLCVVESHWMPARRIIDSASATSMRQLSRLAYLDSGRRSLRI